MKLREYDGSVVLGDGVIGKKVVASARRAEQTCGVEVDSVQSIAEHRDPVAVAHLELERLELSKPAADDAGHRDHRRARAQAPNGDVADDGRLHAVGPRDAQTRRCAPCAVERDVEALHDVVHGASDVHPCEILDGDVGDDGSVQSVSQDVDDAKQRAVGRVMHDRRVATDGETGSWTHGVGDLHSHNAISNSTVVPAALVLTENESASFRTPDSPRPRPVLLR